MIGSLRGKVLQLNGITGLIECAGVGYEVELSLKALQALHAGEEGFVYVYHVVREDASLLYGFADTDEKLLFTELIRIPGLGPRTALAVLSTFSAPEFIAVVERNDAAAFKPVPGVGPKLAERILLEMKTRLEKLSLGTKVQIAPVKTVDSGAEAVREEALRGLITLGYKEKEAQRCLESVYTAGMDTAELIRAVLSLMLRSNHK